MNELITGTWGEISQQIECGRNLARYFALIGENLALIESELDLDLAGVHEVEFTPGVEHKDWWMAIDDKMYAAVSVYQGKCGVWISGYYEEVTQHVNPFTEPASYVPGKLREPVPCEIHIQANEPQQCTGLAHWRLNGVSTCDECIVDMLERLPDNRAWLAPALADIRERHLKVGARVRIQMGDETGNLGTIYNYLPPRPAPWHVRPDRWAEGTPGIAYKAEELDVML